MWSRAGEVRLAAGAHTLTIRLTRDGIRPGVADEGLELGPLAFTERADAGLRTVDPAQGESLCGLRLDWIEAVAG